MKRKMSRARSDLRKGGSAAIRNLRLSASICG